MTITREELATLDVSDICEPGALRLVPPGDVLGMEFMEPMGLTARGLARDLGVPANRITGILNGDRAITADTALLLAGRLGTSAEFWMNLQVAHDLELARLRRKDPKIASARANL